MTAVDIKSKFFEILGIKGLVEQVKSLVEARVELFKLQMKEQIADLMVKLVPILIFSLILFLTIVFLSIAAGFYLSEIFKSASTGFGLVAAFYLLLTLIMSILINNSGVQAYFKKKIMDSINLED